MDWAVEWLEALLVLVLQAAPFLLFGLLAAGVVHVAVPQSLIVRWMGSSGLGGVVRAALVGVPLPVCSCGVVPITVELRRKGASRSASQAFLITTPESSIDSIFLTWGMMGPIMAIARPLGAFLTAILGGILSLGSRGRERHEEAWREAPPGAPSPATRVGRTETRLDLSWNGFVRPAIRYGFRTLVDDLAFWLVVGLLLAATLTVVLPRDLGALGLGAGLLPMVLLLAVAIPLYMCASASTPIAAALLLKGVSPGAALVFLLAGPATNAATVLLLAGTFGRRFVRSYLIAVILGALACGLALDAVLGASGLELSVDARNQGEDFGLVSWISAGFLTALLAWRLWRGAWRHGLHELRRALHLSGAGS